MVTVEEWLKTDVPEGLHAELVDGELEMTPLAELPHQTVLTRLIRQISVYQEAHPSSVLDWSSPARLRIPGDSRGREPDLAIYDAPLDPKKGWIDFRPLIVVEVVSPAQEGRDYVEKRRDYWKAQIPEYWIIDYQRRLFWALRWTPQGWNETILEEAGPYASALLPGFELNIAPLWA